MIQTLLIALSLSMDALAVSISAAACSATLKRSCMLRAAFAFGFFQFAMPMLGWFGASFFVKYAAAFDHWLAFVLLAFVGGKTVVQTVAEMREERGVGMRERKPEQSAEDCACRNADAPGSDVASGSASTSSSVLKNEKTDATPSALNLASFKTLLALAVATSIDALTVGIVYASMGQTMLAPALVIGAVTFAVCACGFFAGKKAGALFGKYAQLAGGVILILIGTRILVSHLLGGG